MYSQGQHNEGGLNYWIERLYIVWLWLQHERNSDHCVSVLTVCRNICQVKCTFWVLFLGTSWMWYQLTNHGKCNWCTTTFLVLNCKLKLQAEWNEISTYGASISMNCLRFRAWDVFGLVVDCLLPLVEESILVLSDDVSGRTLEWPAICNKDRLTLQEDLVLD